MMILGDPRPAAVSPSRGHNRVTLNGIFRSLAARQPDALALVDAPNRAAFTDGAPLRLTYAQADRIVTAIAARLCQMALPPDSVVGIQLPNTVENILTLLGVLRAGMIAAPLPLLWRAADVAAALSRVGAKALIACGRVGATRHCGFALQVAAEVFSIRYLGGFGRDLPDGVVPFDDLLAAAPGEPVPLPDFDRHDDAGRHVAVVTFETGADGPVPVARNHLELLAGGLAVVLESRLAPHPTVLSSIVPSSFGGLSLTLLTWLLGGGTLVLHHPFDADVLMRQMHEAPCAATILPGPVALRLAEAGLFTPRGPAAVLAAWRAPERLAVSADWLNGASGLIDVPIFGEIGLLPLRRGTDGRALPLPAGRVLAPREPDAAGAGGAVPVLELACSEAGTLSLCGPMVPRWAFPPGVERTDLAHLRIGPGGAVDSLYRCRLDPETNGFVVTAPPPGAVCVGGYRLALAPLLTAIAGIDEAATLAALPDPLLGQRLVGSTVDAQEMQTALAALGVNALVGGAFAAHDRPHDAVEAA